MKVEVLSLPNDDKNLAIEAFKGFFLQQTGKNWEDRADGKIPSPKTDKEGNLVPSHESWYANENTGNLFTDWIKACKTPDDMAGDAASGSVLQA